MRYFICILTAAMLLACTNEAVDTRVDEKMVEAEPLPADPLSQKLKGDAFVQFVAATDASFAATDFQHAGSFPLPKVQSGFTPESVAPYHGLLVFDRDSSRAVDLFSYGTFITENQLRGGEADTEAALLDYKNNVRKRLLYLGPSYVLAHASINDSTVTLSGFERMDDNKLKPLFWVINLNEETAELYEYKKTVTASPAEFFRQQYPNYSFD